MLLAYHAPPALPTNCRGFIARSEPCLHSSLRRDPKIMPDLDLQPALLVLLLGSLAIAALHVTDHIGRRRAIRRTRKAIERAVHESPEP